jgi:hypothetical protein
MIPNVFIQNAADILAATNGGLSTSQVVKLCAAYAIDFNVEIPCSSLPLPTDGSVPNKRTALKLNLDKFSPEQQFKIIKELCEHDIFKENIEVKNLKVQLLTRYGKLNKDAEAVNETLIDETRHWLNDYPDSLRIYEGALLKFNSKAFERNLLDDLRLSLELLLKTIFNNGKSLENQIADLGAFIQSKGGSKELSNMFQKLVDYYSKYQNTYVKHNADIIEEEIEFILELTSSFMKHLVRISNR